MIEGKIKTFEAPNNDSTLTERFFEKNYFSRKNSYTQFKDVRKSTKKNIEMFKTFVNLNNFTRFVKWIIIVAYAFIMILRANLRSRSANQSMRYPDILGGFLYNAKNL